VRTETFSFFASDLRKLLTSCSLEEEEVEVVDVLGRPPVFWVVVSVVVDRRTAVPRCLMLRVFCPDTGTIIATSNKSITNLFIILYLFGCE
jgi:hypothetical protein